MQGEWGNPSCLSISVYSDTWQTPCDSQHAELNENTNCYFLANVFAGVPGCIDHPTPINEQTDGWMLPTYSWSTAAHCFDCKTSLIPESKQHPQFLVGLSRHKQTHKNLDGKYGCRQIRYLPATWSISSLKVYNYSFEYNSCLWIE